jgi:hypothetical protein
VRGGVQLHPLGTAATNRPILPTPGDYDNGENRWNDDWQRKPKYSEKTCPSATSSSTNPTCSARTRTRTAAVGSQRLTAWAMARPVLNSYYYKRLNFWVESRWNISAINSTFFFVLEPDSNRGLLYCEGSRNLYKNISWNTIIELFNTIHRPAFIYLFQVFTWGRRQSSLRNVVFK